MSERPKLIKYNGLFWQPVSIVDEQGNSIVNSSGQLKVVLDGTVCDTNSTSTPLSAGAVYTGSWTDVLDYAILQVSVKASHASATDGLEIQYSTDGVNIDNIDNYTIPAATGKTYSFQTAAKYFRIKYTNGGTNQTYFRLQVIKKKAYGKPSSHRIQDGISTDDDAELVKAVLTGQNEDTGFFENVKVSDGEFNVVSRLRNATGNTKINPSTSDNQTNGTQKTQIVDWRGKTWEMDTLNYAGTVIDTEHHELHEGNVFILSANDTLASAGVKMFLITVPVNGVNPHFTFSIRGTTEFNVKLYESPTITDNGTAITPINRNRVSTNTSTLSTYHTPTIAADGTLLLELHGGNAKIAGAELLSRQEWILAKGKSYLLRITSEAAGNDTSQLLEWYEHTNHVV